MVWIILAFLGGISIGLLFGKAWTDKHVIGNLRIDQSDPTEDPYLFLELFNGIHTFSDKKTVHLKVRAENYVSQK